MRNNVWANLLAGHLDTFFYVLMGLAGVAVCYAIYLGVRLASARHEGQQVVAKRKAYHGILGLVVLFMMAPTLLMVGCTPKDPVNPVDKYTIGQTEYMSNEIGADGRVVRLLQNGVPLPDGVVTFSKDGSSGNITFDAAGRLRLGGNFTPGETEIGRAHV